MKNIKLKSLLLLIFMTLGLNAFAGQTNGRNVGKVVYSGGGGASGMFVKTTGKNWVERSRTSNAKFKFVERNRDDWSVYLYDRSRNVNIQLDLHRKKVIYSQGNGRRSDLYNIVSTRKMKGFGKKVKGYNVKKVVHSNQGKFVKTGNKKWTEYGNRGPIFTFKERNRDEWSVYLYDRSRNVNIQLDLYRKKVIYSVGNGAKSDLYNIIKVR